MPDPVGLKDDNEWLMIPRISRTIPFGYKVHEDDEDILVPIIEELEALELVEPFLLDMRSMKTMKIFLYLLLRN